VTHPSPRSPVQLLEPLVRALCFALEAQTQSPIRRLARPLMSLILHRLIALSHRFRRFAERIAAGRAFPRPRGTVRKPATPRKRTPDPLPRKHGWLGNFLPEMAAHRGNLSALLQTPEMAALIAAAPAQMGRALRPLCRMLGLQPPPSIAPPPRRRRAPKPRPAPEPMPSWPHDPRKRTRLGFYKGGPPPFPSTASPRGPPGRKTG
jgi:hypothetical protein